MSDESQTPKVQLGCGTLILIAIIVAAFSQCGVKQELDTMQKQLQRIEQQLSTNRTGDPAPATPESGTDPADPASELDGDRPAELPEAIEPEAD